MITKVKLLDQLKIVLFIYPLVLLYWNYIGDGNDLIEILVPAYQLMEKVLVVD